MATSEERNVAARLATADPRSSAIGQDDVGPDDLGMVLVVDEHAFQREFDGPEANERERSEDRLLERRHLDEPVRRDLATDDSPGWGNDGHRGVTSRAAEHAVPANSDLTQDLRAEPARIGLPALATAPTAYAVGMFAMRMEMTSSLDDETVLTNAAHGLSAAEFTFVQVRGRPENNSTGGPITPRFAQKRDLSRAR